MSNSDNRDAAPPLGAVAANVDSILGETPPSGGGDHVVLSEDLDTKESNKTKINNDRNNDKINDNVNRRSVRKRTTTEKGEEYQLSVLLSQRKSLHNRLLRQLTLVTRCLESTSVEMTNQEVANMDRMLSEFAEVNLKYSELLDDDTAKEECQLLFDKIDADVFEMKTKVCTWLKDHDTDRRSLLSGSSGRSGRSKRSVVSHRSKSSGKSVGSNPRSRDGSLVSRKSNQSYRSNGSNHSSSSSIHSLQNKAHLAGLKVEMEALEQNWNATLEDKMLRFQQEEEARMKEKLSNLKESIAVTEAKQEVFDELGVVEEKESSKNKKDSRTRKRSSSMLTYQRKHRVKFKKRSTSCEREDKQSERNNDRKNESRKSTTQDSLPSVSVNDLGKAVVDMMISNSAPNVELDTFSGNILEFEYFKANFMEVVEKKIVDQRGRLARLLQFTSGDAKELIKGCVHEESETCYDRAMQLLVKEYGDPHETTCAYLKQLNEWPSISITDVKGYKCMYRFLLKCQSFKRGGLLVELDSIDKIRMILTKFPVSVQQAWNKNACKMREREGNKEANFADLVSFIDMQCKFICNSSYSHGAFVNNSNNSNNTKSNNLFKAAATQVLSPAGPSPAVESAATNQPNNPCLSCGNTNHFFEDCPEYLAKPLTERRKFIFHNRLCFGCLAPTTPTHNGKTCTQKKQCRKCNQFHPTCLQHFSVSTIRQPGRNVASLPVVPVVVYHRDYPEQCVFVYAMLDECSQGTFVKDSVLSSLPAVPKRNTSVAIGTLNSVEVSHCLALENLVVAAASEYQSGGSISGLELPTCYTQDTLPLDSKDLPSVQDFAPWPYLTPAVQSIYSHGDSMPVGLLIGANCPKALEPQEVIPSQQGGPYAYRSHLGWCIVGSLNDSSSFVKCNATAVHVPVCDVSTNAIATHHFGIIKSVKECSISEQLSQMYMHDFVEAQSEKKAMSGEDIKFLQLMDEGIKKEENKHYSVPLPFRNPQVKFPNNRSQVVSRAAPLKRRMKKNPKFHEEYTAFVKKVLAEGLARKVDEDQKEDDNAWWIPHHAVYHPTKGKLRVVFDCAAKFQGRCLNDELLQGPDLANLIVGVLLRFRKEEVAVQADITWMFFQVLVPSQQQKFLRFVYWPDGDLDAELEDYQMCAHLFGARSSTSCCIYALRRTALDNKDKYDEAVCDTLLNNFYVDDLLKSYLNDAEAVDQITKVIELCEEGGFTLAKFVSNSAAVRKALPEEKKASSTSEMNIDPSTHIERALGVLWFIEIDQLGFRISMENKPPTRAGMLSTISSAFDPMGLAGPFLKKGKGVLQLVNTEKKDWEEPVSGSHAAAWDQWKHGLLDLSKLTVDRCYKPAGFGKAVYSSIHCFSDASETGYGQATYLRQENEKGDIAVSLVMGKSRVAPSKVTTIPRLELVAATVAVKVAALVKEELQIEELDEYYYTDSEIVLGYMGNDGKRYRTFVANRRQLIRTYTKYEKWRYILSAENPADLASRGMAANETEKVNGWFQGPGMLRTPRSTWQITPPSVTVDDNDPEVLNSVNVLVSKVNDVYDILECLEKHISQWEKMVRTMVYIRRAAAGFKSVLRKVDGVSGAICKSDRANKKTDALMLELSHVNVGEFVSAENRLVLLIQQRSYPDEMKLHQNKENPKKQRTRLSPLDPFVDEEGLLRVGGRLRRAGHPDVVKHPVILPDKKVATRCLVRYYHKKVHHSGRTTTVGEIRQSGFWVVNLSSCVRNIIYNCVPCRALRGKLADQKMADLPGNRATPEGPFVHVGVDVFGHFFVKEKRSEVKRYVVMFTCMSSRAVHLEMIKDMSTDSFILALRRFLARRGPAKSIRSDNGTNFVGAKNELAKCWKEMDHKKIEEFLLGRKCDWIDWERNPPAASHMGGVWERQIRTIRSILTSLLLEHSARLDDEALRTLLCETECVVNSRPITVENLGDPHSEILTPNHLLTMKSKVLLPPPGEFQKQDVYCRKRWRAVQYLANQFWARWRKEFLVTLQQRVKWTAPKRNFQVNDVVLIKDEDCSRNQWPMGRVVNAIESDHDKLVRAVDLYCPRSKSTLRRPIHKLVLLVGADEHC